MATLDVLVCGQCHSAFHFVEEFTEHKEANNCTGKSPVRDSVSISREQIYYRAIRPPNALFIALKSDCFGVFLLFKNY